MTFSKPVYMYITFDKHFICLNDADWCCMTAQKIICTYLQYYLGIVSYMVNYIVTIHADYMYVPFTS